MASEPVRRTAVLFHGFSSTAEETFGKPGWIRSLEKAGFTVIAPDLPGHGNGLWKAFDTREALVEWAEKTTSEAAAAAGGSVDVVGYSLGSTLAWQLGCQTEGLVRRIVMAGVPAHDHLADLAEGADTPAVDFLRGLIDETEKRSPGSRSRLEPLIESSARSPFSAEDRVRSGEIPHSCALIAAGTEDTLALRPEEFAEEAERQGLTPPTVLSIEGRDHVSVLPSGELRRAVVQALLD